MSALANRKLIDSNFSIQFKQQHPSFEMVRERIKQRKKRIAEKWAYRKRLSLHRGISMVLKERAREKGI